MLKLSDSEPDGLYEMVGTEMHRVFSLIFFTREDLLEIELISVCLRTAAKPPLEEKEEKSAASEALL